MEITKKFILDTLGVALAGSNAVGCKEVLNLITDWQGKEESTVIMYGNKVPSPNAALINSMMAHALDFDDAHDTATLHANVTVLPAVLALAEREGGVSGQALIAAVATGNDIACRLGLSLTGPLTWLKTSTMGYFGATLACGKILGLDEEKMLHAIGIAYSQCAGNPQCLVDGGLVKRMQPAFAAKAGVLSALLAQQGITGATNIFEGKHGFFPLYHPGKDYDRKKITEGLGRFFEGTNLSVKLYPCCRATNGCIDATLGLVTENNIPPEEISAVIAHVTQTAYGMVGKPFEIREVPQVDAQFSIPYTMAIAITGKRVSIDDFFESKIRSDAQRLELARKVEVIADQEPVPRHRCVIEIKMKNGRSYSNHVEILKGDPRNPVSFEDVAAKFRESSAFAAKSLSSDRAEEIINLIKSLETVSNIDTMVKMLV